MLCTVHAATVIVSASSMQLSELQGDQLMQIQLSTDIGKFSFAGQASNRRLLGSSRLQQHSRNLLQQGSLNKQQALDKLLSDVKQMKDGSNMDMKPLIEMARAASGPDQVVIVDDSLAARNMRRGGSQVRLGVTPLGLSEPQTIMLAAFVTATCGNAVSLNTAQAILQSKRSQAMHVSTNLALHIHAPCLLITRSMFMQHQRHSYTRASCAVDQCQAHHPPNNHLHLHLQVTLTHKMPLLCALLPTSTRTTPLQSPLSHYGTPLTPCFIL
jgi:hypothetical protein